MTNDKLNEYYSKAVKTFEFSKVDADAFWATVSLILCEEGIIEKEVFADCLTTLGKLPAYASNMEKQMVKCKALQPVEEKAVDLAAKYIKG